MSEFDFDNIGSLLDDVLNDKPITDATPEAPQPDDKLEVVDESMVEPEATVITDPEVDSVEDMLADLMKEDEPCEAAQPAASEAPSANGTPSEDSETPDAGDATEEAAGSTTSDTTEEVAQCATSGHVFAEPKDQGKAIPVPTFTSDEIADSLDIRNFATLVTLNTARWHAKAKDRTAAKAAADAAGAKAEAFEARKALLVGADTKLKQVHKAIDAARTEHYRLTMPWSTVGVNDVGKRTGGRLMPNTLFMEYTTAMAKAKAEMDKLVADFVKDYPVLVTQAQANLGSAFDPAQYPNPSSIASHFRLSFDFNPIPVGSDFKGLQDAQVQKLGSALDKKTRTMLENAMQDAWVQLYETVKHTADVLSDPAKMFHKTLVEKLKDQAHLLTHLNATKDPRIEEIRKAVDAKLTKHDPKDIRKDEALRKHLAEEAQDIVDKMREVAHGSA